MSLSGDEITLHIIAPFHTIVSIEWSHCAFTGKVLRFSKMMRKRGYKVIEYSNGTTESMANEQVMILSREELERHLDKKQAFHGGNAVINSPLHKLFHERLVPEVKKRVKDGDIVCHPFGFPPHISLVEDLKEVAKVIHVESGIGYPNCGLAFRIYESYAWMHWHYGKGVEKVGVPTDGGSNYHFVAPNYFDLEEWDVVVDPSAIPNPLTEAFEDHRDALRKRGLSVPSALLDTSNVRYIGFLGRVYDRKGVDLIVHLANQMPDEMFVICGQIEDEDRKRYIGGAVHHNLMGVEAITGRARSAYMGSAKCMLMPTKFIEPFGGSGVEGMLCGTPLIASDFGAFTETVEHGVTGYRCHTMGDWIAAIKSIGKLSRSTVAERARARYSLETIGKTYDGIFKTLRDLLEKGYYTLHSHII